MTTTPSHPIIDPGTRAALEAAVSQYAGRDWRARKFTDLQDLSSHPAAVLSDGSLAVFAKLSAASNASDQFQVEAAGLRLLSERAGVRTPAVIGIVPAPGGFLLLLEAVEEVERGPLEWREIGRTLARIHQVQGQDCGLERQGYFGSLYQDNRPMPGWRDFFLERRLWPRFMGAIDSGRLPTETIRKVERLAARLPGLDLPEARPSLLHGDAQKNNYISTAAGAVVIDPAPFYGDPEVDLAHLEYFQPAAPEVYEGYREILPIPAGFEERRELWRIPTYLAIVGMGEYPEFYQRLQAALAQYV